MLLSAAQIAVAPASVDPFEPVDAMSVFVDFCAPCDAPSADSGERSPDPLHGWLAVQLLAQGYTLASEPVSAQVKLTITSLGTHAGWEVIAAGSSSARFEVEAAEQPAVARLELLHRAVDAVEAVEPKTLEPQSAGPTFAIEIDPGVAAEQRRSGEREIAAAVLTAGGTIVSQRAAADFVLCAQPGTTTPQLHLVRSETLCETASPADPFAVPSPTAQRTQRLVAAAAALTPQPVPETPTEPFAAALTRVGEDDETPPGLESTPTVPTRRRAWPGSTGAVRLGAAAGVVVRGAVDPMVTTSLYVGREPGLSAWLDVQLWLSSFSGPLRIWEATPAAGLRLRALTQGRFSLDFGALLGLQVHSFRLVDEPALRTEGVALDVSSEGAVGFSLRTWGAHELQLLVRGGRTGRSRIHTDDSGSLWARSAWRLGGSLGLNFGWRRPR